MADDLVFVNRPNSIVLILKTNSLKVAKGEASTVESKVGTKREG